MVTVLISIGAYMLDLIFGDPKRLPHPTRLIGKLIIFLENIIRKNTPETPHGEKSGGLILAVIVLSISFLTPLVLLIIAYKISTIFGVLVEIFLCYTVIAVKSMGDEAKGIYNELENHDLAAARKKLSGIVGRDTKNLDEKNIIKASVESVSESGCDGVVAPLFFMLIGGAPLAFLYKAANTLDSMVGYKNDKYLYFGYFSAKIDDILNFIPARITGLLYILASFCLGYNGHGAKKIFFRDRLNHSSPNSAHSEAAVAGGLNIRLGGGSFYFGKFIAKPFIGDDLRPPKPNDILKSLYIFNVAGIMALLLFIFLRLVVLLVLNTI